MDLDLRTVLSGQESGRGPTCQGGRQSASPQRPVAASLRAYERLGDVAQAGGDLGAARGFFDKALELRRVGG